MSMTLRILQLLAFTSVLSACAAPSETVKAKSDSGSIPSSAVTKAAVIKATVTTASTPRGAAQESPSNSPSSGYMQRPEVQSFAQQLSSERQIPLADVAALLSQARRQASVIRLIAPAPPGQPRPPRDWAAYERRFVEPIRINRGRAFVQANRAMLEQAQNRYGVPLEIIAAIIGVETLYGDHLGNFRVLDAITTLSFDYPEPRRPERVAMFQGQLADLIELHHQGRLDATRQLGSYAGAMGIPQFMPTSLKEYAVSANAPRAIDLENRVDDAIFSVANFLKVHGWITGLPVFAPVTLPPNPAGLVEGGLTPTLTWQALQLAGARLDPGASDQGWASHPLGVIDLPIPGRNFIEYRTATPNFFALTQYNRSYFYATAVADLARALRN
jgi:membrane-bound lytic murein transglycosylase B